MTDVGAGLFFIWRSICPGVVARDFYEDHPILHDSNILQLAPMHLVCIVAYNNLLKQRMGTNYM